MNLSRECHVGLLTVFSDTVTVQKCSLTLHALSLELMTFTVCVCPCIYVVSIKEKHVCVYEYSDVSKHM